MSRDVDQSESPILENEEELIAFFKASEKSSEYFRVGAETERVLYSKDTVKPIPYEGGIRPLLEAMTQKGWNLEPLGLNKDGMSVSLEPGGQLELAGKAVTHTDAIREEVDAFNQQVLEVCERKSNAWSWGCKAHCNGRCLGRQRRDSRCNFDCVCHCRNL